MLVGSMKKGLGIVAVLGCAAGSQALTFNFSYDSGINPNVVAGFAAAGDMWSAKFNDDVTVNVKIAFGNLGSSIISQAGSNYITTNYSAVRNALTLDAKSSTDYIAVGSLQSGSALSVVTNRWSNNPNGAGSVTPYATSLTGMEMTTANAKALGLLAGNDAGLDSSITLNSAFSWDFDRSNGISAGNYDFVGIAVHELGHSLGFNSGVDYLEYLVGYNHKDTDHAWIETLDLYRYSSGYSVPDLCANGTAKFFSIDGGLTGGSNLLATGQYGNGYPNGH